MKATCEHCQEEFDFIPDMNAIRGEIKEKVLDRWHSSTDEELSDYIDQLQKCVLDAAHDALNEAIASLGARRAMAAEKFGSKF